jgi:integrase/recombinase XerD
MSLVVQMALGKQAKILTKVQVDALVAYLGTRRHGLRDQTIFLLSVRAGLRAKEIAGLKWFMVMDADGAIGDAIHLTDTASKGRGGRMIPLNKQLKLHIVRLLEHEKQKPRFDSEKGFVITTERSARTSAQAIVNLFSRWYAELGLIGCSSHSGRRTFITNAARKISTVGGSLRDVQALAGHSSLAITQRYIEGDEQARLKIVDLI